MTAVLFVGGVVGTALVARGRRIVSPESNVIAIAPFSVVDSSLALWRDGLVEVLSRNLDGAGPIRAVAPSSVINQWHGPADTRAAAQLASRTHASLVTFGSVIPAGKDSVRVIVAIYDGLAGHAVADIEYRDDTKRLDRVADSLTARLIAELSRVRNLGDVRSTSIGTRSITALKEFLRAKQFARQDFRDSAILHYTRAISVDGDFAIAYLERGETRWRSGPLWDGDIRSDFERAAALNHGLGRRDSTLIGLNVFLAQLIAGPFPHARTPALFRGMFSALEQFPDDPQLWNALGEAWAHLGPYYDGTAATRQTLEVMKHAYALDPANREGLGHILSAGGALGDTLTVLHYVALDSSRERAASSRSFIPDIVRDRPVTDERIDSLLQVRGTNIGAAPWATDSAEQSIRIQRRLLRSPLVRLTPLDSFRRSEALAGALMRRGHIRAALAEDPGDPDYLLEWALLTRASVDSQRALLDHAIARAPYRSSYWLAWAARGGDTALLDSIAGEAREHHPGIERPVRWQDAEYILAATPGIRALVLRDSVTAARVLDAIPDSLCGAACGYLYLVRARLANAQRRYRAALKISEYAFEYPLALTDVFLILEHAHAAEGLGLRDEAATSYRRVLDTWRHPDPELQQFLRDSQAGLQRVARAR